MKTDMEGKIIWTADLSGWAKDPVMKKYADYLRIPAAAVSISAVDPEVNLSSLQVHAHPPLRRHRRARHRHGT